jgi:hypothetical protein
MSSVWSEILSGGFCRECIGESISRRISSIISQAGIGVRIQGGIFIDMQKPYYEKPRFKLFRLIA